MSDFTPGPWHCITRDQWTDTERRHEQMSSVCHVGDYTITTEYQSYYSHGSDEADANLIAAAPELYEALNIALKAFAFDDEGPTWADSLIVKARAALAKARGESC